MAKRMVLDALQGVLSDYLEIDESNFDLNLAVWSGSITLHDVKVRNDNIFRGLNIAGVYGVVRKLEVKIPWTALMSSPVCVEIDGVYLQLKPVEVGKLDKAEARKRMFAAKQEKIAFADKFLSYHSHHDGANHDDNSDKDDDDSDDDDKPKKKGKQSWVEAWTTKIVDNLEITLKNIHVRYEDSDSVPGKTFSAGITLSSFILATCDEKWKSSFVARKDNQAIRKLCRTENMGFYWNMQSPSLKNLPFEDWQNAMQSMIYLPPPVDYRGNKVHFVDNQKHAQENTPESMKFMLLPTNNIEMKIVHNDHLTAPGHGQPKYDITIATEEINLSLDGLQYKQLNTTIDKINAVEKTKQPNIYKPRLRPVDKESIRLWWKYACKLAIKRPKYIKLVKLSKTANPNDSFKDSLTALERDEMKVLEERLPLNTVIIFRHMAADEMAFEAKKAKEEFKRNKAAAKGKSRTSGGKEVSQRRSWWGFFAGEPSPSDAKDGDTSLTWDDTLPDIEKKAKDELEEDVSISSIMNELEEYRKTQEDKHTTHNVFYKLSLKSSAVLNLSAYSVPVLHASMSLNANSVTTSTGTKVDLDMNDMRAVDMITKDPVMRDIVSVKQISETSLASSSSKDATQTTANKPSFTVKFESTAHKNTMHITSLPLQLACNQACIQNIIEILFYPKPPPEGKTAADELIKEKRKRLQTTNALLVATSGHDADNAEDEGKKKKKGGESTEGAFEITFEAHAPKILIPQESSSEKGYLLLDTGYLSVKGFTGEAGMSWDICLSDVNAGLPLRVQDIYKLAQKGNEHMYLIKPFDIAMAVQNIDRSDADMTVDLHFKPGIHGELSAPKLTRLMNLMGVASKTFLTPPNTDLPEMQELKLLDIIVNSPPKTKIRTNISRGSLSDMGTIATQALQAKKSGVNLISSSMGNQSNASVAGGIFDEDAADNSDIQYLIADLNMQEEATAERDATHVGLLLTMNIPTVALHLTYDEERGDHQVFEVQNMTIRLINRPNDLNFSFTMGSFSIQDSMRSASQRYFVSTPEASDDLIDISYITCQTKHSPYYKDHGSICVVNFANLNLLLDVNTLMHLRPFLIVLLHGDSQDDAKQSNGKFVAGISDKASANVANLSEAAAAQVNAISVSQKPEHMHMTISMQNLSLDILRVDSEEDGESNGRNKAGILDKAFSLQLIGMHCDLDMRVLMKAVVSMKSVEVLDTREISRDYAIKKVFGPMTLGRAKTTETASPMTNSSVSASTSAPSYSDGESDGDEEERDMDIVRLDFHQESKEVSHIDILVSDACTFGSTDTFLDLSNVALDNFLAMITLLEKPPPDFYKNPSGLFTSVSSELHNYDIDEVGEESYFRDSMSNAGDDSSSTKSAAQAAAAIAETTKECNDKDVDKLDPTQFLQQTMVVVARIKNPRLLLIDDPTAEDSQAIVGTCLGEMHYTRSTTTEIVTGIKEFRESMHMSIKQLEVYVLKNVQNYFPKAILQPMTMEFNMRREAYDGNVLLTNISVDTGSTLCRVSLNDIVLAQSILMRSPSVDSNAVGNPRLAANAGGLDGSPEKSKMNLDKAEDLPPRTNALKPETQYNIAMNLGQINFIAINDFSSQDLPVARMQFDEISFSLQKKGDVVEGQGDLYASSAFYNSQIHVWEPILDRWHPKFSIDSGRIGSIYNIQSAHTMQVTVSGKMLKSFLETSSLLQQVQESGNTDIGREIVPDMLVENALGATIDVDLYDSMSGKFLVSLASGKAAAIPKVLADGKVTKGKKGTSRKRGAFLSLPSSVDLHFSGDFGQERAPILNLPMYLNKPRLCHIHTHTKRSESESAGSSEKNKAMPALSTKADMVAVEPIEEETFENQRFDQIRRCWREPYMVDDPSEWTDSSGLIEKKIEDIDAAGVKDGRWEWQGRWNISTDLGSFGVDFDEDGWEYSTAFSNFSIANVKRTHKKLDQVRRRRWTRTRTLKNAAMSERQRLLVLHWDVRTLSNGARSVLIRSGLRFRNNMPFPISLILSYAAWNNDVELGPIAPNDTFCVPLFVSCATGMMVRPAVHLAAGDDTAADQIAEHDWSRTIPCGIQTYDFTSSRGVVCKESDQSQSMKPICMFVNMKQESKSLMVTFDPYIVVENRMPCDLRYKIDSSDGKSQEEEIMCGATRKVYYVNTAVNPSIVILRLSTISTPMWSQAVTLPQYDKSAEATTTKERENITIELPNSQGTTDSIRNNGLVMNIFTSIANGTLQVVIFPRYLLIDRSNLNLSVRTYRELGKEMQRDTFIQKAKHDIRMRASTVRMSKSSIRMSTLTPNNIENIYLEWEDDQGICPISNFNVDSSNEYILTTASHSDSVYTDSSYIWSHLPVPLRDQRYIRSSFNDKLRRARNFIQFDLKIASYVIVLVDMRSKGSPAWLKEDGFKEMGGHAVARRIHLSEMQEICYTAYGKYFDAHSHVNLRGNYNKDITVMYGVFVVPIETNEADPDDLPPPPNAAGNQESKEEEDFFGQIDIVNQVNRKHANSSWQDGGRGMCLFYTSEDRMTIGVENGKAWSDEISITMANVSHNQSFEVVDYKTQSAYQLTYNMRYMPGSFSNTQEIVVMPKFAVVNLLDEELMIIQKGAKDVRTYQPYRADSWHKNDVKMGTTVQIRCRSSYWSLGTVDISEMGTSSIHLPRKDDSTNGAEAIILHVEVKFALPGENCSVVVLVWRATVESSTDIYIQNDTDCPIAIMQAGVELDKELTQRRLFQLCLAPLTSSPFGWADPDLNSSVLVSVGLEINTLTKSGRNPNQRIAEISLLKAGVQIRLPDNSGRKGALGEVVLSVNATNGARVLRISRPDDITSGGFSSSEYRQSITNANDNDNGKDEKGYEINFFLSSFGLSLVVEHPIRREFLSLYLDGLSMQQLVCGGMKSTEVKIQNLQVDNYSETCIYAVLMHEKKDEGHPSDDKTNSAGAKPLVQISWVTQDSVGENRMPIYKFLVCRVLPLSIQVDSATIQLLYTDLLDDLKYISREQTLASATPNEWMDERNRYLLSPERNLILDVYTSKARSMIGKMYFETLLIHPFHITFTFTQAAYPRKRGNNATLQSTFMNIVTSFAGVEDLDLKLNSFKVSDALESYESLQAAFMYKTMSEIKGQLVDVVGSMAAIGAPLGFAKKIGSGVSDLFYEPLHGIVTSPKDFVNGIGKGATSFASHVVSGFGSSIGGMSTSATKGLGYLAGDGDYVRQRAAKRQSQKTSGGGFFEGVVGGAEAMGSGVTSGLSGLVSRPIEGAQKSGVGGFFKGVGLGLLGAVVKPVMGFTDGVSAVATGVTAEVNNEAVYVHVRPVRAMERSKDDPAILVVGPMNVKAAKAQEFVMKRAQEQHYEDFFLSYTLLNEKTDEAIILTETYFYWRKEKSLWGRTWSNISHCMFFGDSVGVFLYTSTNSGKEIVEIPCKSRDVAISLYEVLALHTTRMGNPCNVIPLSAVAQEEWLTDRDFRESILEARGRTCSLDNRLDGYKFGTVNEAFRPTRDIDEDVMLRGFQKSMERPFSEWSELDARVWSMVEAWDTNHTGLGACRCCAFTIINRSESPVQIVRIQMVHGRRVVLLGSGASGYDSDSRAIMPNGVVIVFASGFVPSPLEVGHLKAQIDCPAFTSTVASTQRESSCEGRGTFHVGFLEKSVSEWWSKYVLCVS